MAKGDVTLKFDADTGAFVQKVLAARSAMDQAANKAREVGDSFDKSGKHVERFADKVKDSALELVKLAAIPTSIMGAIDLTLKAVENRLALAEQRAKALEGRSATFESAIYTLGAGSQARDIRGQLEHLSKSSYGGRKFDDGDVESIFAQIVQSVGPRATPEQFIAATRTALGAHGAGANIGQAVQAGAGMATIQSVMPGMDEDQADQMARFMQANAPGLLQNDRAMAAIATARDPMGAARFFAAGYQQFQGARRIKPLEDLVDAGRTSYERILESPETLPPKERSIAAAIIAGESKLRPVGSRAEEAAASMAGGDLIRSAAIAAHNAEAAKGQTLDKGAEEAAITEAVVKLARAKLEASDMEGSAIKALTPDWYLRLQATSRIPGRAPLNDRDYVGQADVEIRDLLRELNEHAATIRSNTSGGPMLNNDKEGQK